MDDSKVKIFPNPKELIDYLDENSYTTKSGITLSKGLVSPTNEIIKPRFSIMDYLFSFLLYDQRNAKPISEVFKTGLDDNVESANLRPLEKKNGAYQFDFLDNFYSAFPSNEVERYVERLNGALPAIGVWKDVDKYKSMFGYSIPHGKIPDHLEKLVIMQTEKK